MGDKKKKSKKTVRFDEFKGVSEFLDGLSSYFNGNAKSMELDILPDLTDFYEIGLTIKKKEGRYQVKFKSKELDSEVEKQRASREDDEKAGKPKYKVVKKRMKSSFYTIKSAILAETPPDEAAMLEFLEDSKRMVSYKGYGDEYYSDYVKACSNLKTAYESGSIEKMSVAFLKVDKLRQDCHNRHL